MLKGEAKTRYQRIAQIEYWAQLRPNRPQHLRGLGLYRFIRSKATCAAPLSEVLSPCRGRRPHHVQKDRIGSWEVSGLTGAVAVAGPHREGEEPWPMMHGPEKSDPGIVAMKPANKTKQAHSGGVCWANAETGGAKGGDQGECGPAKHVPDA